MSLTVSELLALEGLSALRLRAGKQGCSGPYAGTTWRKMNISPSGSWAASWCLSPASTIPGMKPT
nr:hypothetical protein [Klebsiella pneumoniae subsp. pneumoniae]